MNISHQQPPNVIFEDLGPAKLKRRHILPPLPSLPHFRNPLIGIPIAQRLVFGFLIPALIAALAAGIIGIRLVNLWDARRPLAPITKSRTSRANRQLLVLPPKRKEANNLLVVTIGNPFR